MALFRDRADAGRRLAARLGAYAGRSGVLVLALPRGGVQVGAVVARELGVPLDVLVIRRLGAPGQSELAMGAIARGVRVINEEIVQALGVPDEEIDRVEAREREELERRERAYRGPRPPLELRGRTVILVDDGVATGSTALAALRLVHSHGPARVVVAVPVAAPESMAALYAEADEVVAVATPSPFIAISVWYEQFPELGDEDVRALLASAGVGRPAGAGGAGGAGGADASEPPAPEGRRAAAGEGDLRGAVGPTERRERNR